MVIPQKFRKTGEPIIATYDFTDVADGTGVIAFNLGVVATDATQTFILSRNPFFSQDPGIGVTSTQIRNFDLPPFALPKTVKGTAFLNIGYATTSAGNDGLKVQIIKVSGGTPSDVSSQIEAEFNAGALAHNMLMIPIPLTKTTFSKGDILRCEVEMIVQGGTNEIGTDPMGRDGSVITSALTAPTMTTVSKLFMPFEIDL